MADANRATCPRCGVPLPAGQPPGLCRRCLLWDTQGGQSEDRPFSLSSSGGARRKLGRAWAVAAIGAMLFGGVWFGNRWRQQAEAQALLNRGTGLHRQGKLEEALAAYRAAIRLKPHSAEARVAVVGVPSPAGPSYVLLEAGLAV
jgi:Tetratricopeptide repeat